MDGELDVCAEACAAATCTGGTDARGACQGAPSDAAPSANVAAEIDTTPITVSAMIMPTRQ